MKEGKAYIGDEIVEGNKLIAEFDGWELCSNKKKYWWAKPGVTWDCFDPPEFNHNWELLMPVVEKIWKIEDEVSLGTTIQWIFSCIPEPIMYFDGIETLWKAVIHYLKTTKQS